MAGTIIAKDIISLIIAKSQNVEGDIVCLLPQVGGDIDHAPLVLHVATVSFDVV